MKKFKKIVAMCLASMMSISAICISAYAENDDIVVTYTDENNQTAYVTEDEIKNGPVTITAYDGCEVTIKSGDKKSNFLRAAQSSFIGYIPSASALVGTSVGPNGNLIGSRSYSSTFSVNANSQKYSPYKYIPNTGYSSLFIELSTTKNMGFLTKAIIYKNQTEYLRTEMLGSTGIDISMTRLSTNDETYIKIDNISTETVIGDCVVTN